MIVELLRHRGCPHADAARDLLRDCLAGLGIDAPILDRVGGFGSPTVLIDGADVMGGTVHRGSAGACRLDRPTRERVHAAVQAARSVNDRRCPG